MGSRNPLKWLCSGQYMTRVEIGNEYDIDDEGLANFMEFDLDYALNRIQLNDAPSGAVHYLLGLGTVQLFKGSHSDWDRMLRISNQLFRHGLQPILHDPHAIIAHLNAKRAALGLQVVSKAESVAPCQGDLF